MPTMIVDRRPAYYAKAGKHIAADFYGFLARVVTGIGVQGRLWLTPAQRRIQIEPAPPASNVVLLHRKENRNG